MSGAFDPGAFDNSFDDGGTTPPGGGTFSGGLDPDSGKWRLDPFSVGSIDDHPRPTKGLWAYYRPPDTQKGLLLYRTGQVVLVDNFMTTTYYTADDAVAGGHETYFAPGAWQINVLINAGLTLTQVPGYGVGLYGVGPYGG